MRSRRARLDWGKTSDHAPVWLAYPPDHDLMKMLRAHAEVRRSEGAVPALPSHANDEPSDDNAA